MSAASLDQSAIWYSACNEDGASEIAALQPQGKRVLCITASGSRAFDLLLADPAHVLAIDQNPAQTALAELFVAAYRQLDYADFAALAGLREDPRRGHLLDQLLPSLSPEARMFWQANRTLAAGGLVYCGKWESFLRRFKRWAGPRRQRLARQLLACPTREAQWELWQDKWDDWQWRLFLRALALRWLWRHVLKEPGIDFIPPEFDMTRYARERFDHAARHLHLGTTPFAWLLLNGAYRADVLPPYLTEAGHGLIRQRLDRLTLGSASLQQTLAEAAQDAFDAVSLSDYSSYCDLAEQQRVWADLRRILAPGGRVCERKFFNKTGMAVPQEHGFTRDAALEARLDGDDGAWFYTFVVAVKDSVHEA